MFDDLIKSSGKKTVRRSPDVTATSQTPKSTKFGSGNSQSLESQLSNKDSQGSSGSSLISRLQNRYKRGIAAASQNITQLTTQVTQDVQKDRLDHVKKLADSIVKKDCLTDLMPSMDTGFYGLPDSVREALERLRGIKKLYDWQDTCLRLPSLRERRNLIYTCPTSGGKTLVAEILILRELLLRRKDCILILPFVSLVQEKIRGMSELAVELDFLVEEYAGSRGSYPPKKRQKRKSLYVATIEKANGLINSLIEVNRLESIGLCVVDELHMLGEAGRGATLEMSLTKLLLANRNTQLIGMSATLNNMDDLARFLNAEVYSNDYRPVELDEYVKMGEDLFKVDPRPLPIEEKLKHSRTLNYNYDATLKNRDPDYLTGLLLEVIPKYSCLIFCSSKRNCESVAQLVCTFMPRSLKEVKKEERDALCNEIRDNCGHLCPILSSTLIYGVAYHHSGLTMDERKLIEEAYVLGTLCCIICTSTLAAGINLPAKRVIIRAPYVGLSLLGSSQYRQMIGRAGRAGIDTSGESILIIQPKDRKKVETIVAGPSTCCESKLNVQDGTAMRKLVLNLIGIKLASNVQEVYDAVQTTLYAKQHKEKTVLSACNAALSSLSDLKLVIQKCNSEGVTRLEVSELGIAAYKGTINVDIANKLYEDLYAAQRALSVQNYLHLIYLITPYELVSQVNVDWSLMFDMHGRLGEPDSHVADAVGVSERFLHRMTINSKKNLKLENVHIRFFIALMLYDLYREMPVWQVADKYHQNRGFVQSMLQSAISFASCVYNFSKELEQLWAYSILYEQFMKKFSLCARPELNALMELPGVKIGKARLLYKAGFATLQQIAFSEPQELVTKVDYMSRAQARQLKASATLLIHEKSESLRAEADAVIALPTPVPAVSP
ncbi:helicase POLQ-like [Watersipora subatra]|uniref:helicase POLQ-like n=1 Tax=Watersipora subatra TaxID=2589382 RepID=UPI00355C232D